MPIARDPVQTQRRILRAARNEFMRHGYSGARIERISRAARSSDRMIYYYFASKEALYLQVLESVYSELGEAESALALDPTRPAEALDQLIAFTWRYYLEHPEFVALLSNENLMRGLHITKSVKVKLLSRPVLEILGTILAEGTRQGLFRRGLDVKKVYLTLAALGYFYLSNRFTLSSFLGTDLMRPSECDAWLAEIRRVMAAAVGAPAAPEAASETHGTMAAYDVQKILTVHHWNESLFTFTCTRGASLRFESGHFVMVGIVVDGKPLLRAYSIASAHYEEHLEFFSIKVPNGPLTSRLQHMKVGDDVLVGRKPTGTLVLTDLLPGRFLYLFATGTGLAPFMSIIRDPATYERFERVVLVHGVRKVDELAYADLIAHDLPRHDHLGEQVRSSSSTTRQ